MLAVLEPGGSIGPHAADRMTRVIALARRGQAQRVAACMFVRTPDLLVFDDLASALDVETERTLWGRVFEAEAGLPGPACLVVSHRRAAQIILCE